MAFTVYILECADRSLYIGHTDNLDRRMHQHDVGIHGCYTATRRPLKLLHAEEFETRYEALVIERRLKGWSRAKKLAYVRGDWDAIHRLAAGPARENDDPRIAILHRSPCAQAEEPAPDVVRGRSRRADQHPFALSAGRRPESKGP